jgi:hypothetical protein
MRVKFRTFPAPLGAGETFGRFQRGLAKAGYVTRTVAIDGRPILLGIHPDTRVMLSVRFATDRRGRSTVRVAQENLAELDPAFRAELPGVPVHPDATGRVLLEPLAGDGARSLTYSTGAAASSVRRFYLAEMERAGWSFVASPFEADPGSLSVLFFTRDDSECSIVLAPAAGASGTVVLVNLGGITERRS